jgi:nucleoside-diphosphate-sugar epimerase
LGLTTKIPNRGIGGLPAVGESRVEQEDVVIEKVLVTGGCGRLGHYVVDELRTAYQVTTLDVTDSLFSLPHLRLSILDLPGLRRASAGQDAVVHLAALDGHLAMPAERFFEVNALGTWNVLEAAFDAGAKRVIVASSNSAIGLSDTESGRRPLYLPLDEAHPAWPTQAYGLSKLINEVTAEGFGRRNKMKITCIRPTYIMFPELVPFIAARAESPGEPPPATHPNPAVAAALREPLSLLRCYVEPGDLARLFRLALEHDGASYELFYGSASDSFEPRPTLSYLERMYGGLPEVRKPWVYDRNPHAAAIDCTHALEVLGWEPTSDWVRMSGLRRQPAS